MAFMEPMHFNEPNITYFLTYKKFLMKKENNKLPFSARNIADPFAHC